MRPNPSPMAVVLTAAGSPVKALYCEVSRNYDKPVRYFERGPNECHSPEQIRRMDELTTTAAYDAKRYQSSGMTTDMILTPANLQLALDAVKQKHFAATPTNCETDAEYDSPVRL
jgi:hypothetical protein